MLVFFCALIRSEECGLPAYPRVLEEADSALRIQLSATFVERAFVCAFDHAVQMIDPVWIPSVEVPIAGNTYKMHIGESTVTSASLGAVQVTLHENNTVELNATGVNIRQNVPWTLEQRSYPYVQESGEGLAVFGGVAVVVSAQGSVDKSCPGKLQMSAAQATKFGFEHLSLDFYGEVLTEALEYLEGTYPQLMLRSVVSDLEQLALQSLLEVLVDPDRYFQSYNQYLQVIKDDRVVTGLRVQNAQLLLHQSGYVYQKTNLSDEFVSQSKLQLLKSYKQNQDISFQVQKAALNNAFYVFHTYYSAYSKSGLFKAETAPYFSIVAENLILHLVGSTLNDEKIQLELFAEPSFEMRHHEISFKFTVKNCTGSCTEAFLTEYIAFLDAVVEHANYKVDCSLFTASLKDFAFFFDAEQQTVTMSANVDSKCPAQ